MAYSQNDSLTVDSPSLSKKRKLFKTHSDSTVLENNKASVFDTIPSAVSNTNTINKDSLNTKKKQQKHKPWLAALLSAGVPGLGQAYNKKYWKIPIVYAGFAGLSYAVYHTATNFKGYRDAYRLDIDNDPLTDGIYKGVTNENTLREYRIYHKRNLDISAICLGVWYVLNIVDATVDAHLFNWNMNDQLSLNIQPVVYPYTYGFAPGIGMNFNIKDKNPKTVTLGY